MCPSPDHFQALIECLKCYDLNGTLLNLDTLNTDDACKAFKLHLASPGAYNIHEDRKKRDKFYNELLKNQNFIQKHKNAQILSNKLYNKIIKIERQYDFIKQSLLKCDISRYPENIQFWSHIERASQQLQNLRKKGLAVIETMFEEQAAITFPERLLVVEQNNDEIDIDTANSVIIDNLSLIIKFLCYKNKWYVENKTVGPIRPKLIDETHIYKAGSIQLYASSWNALEDIANRTLFFDGEIESFEAAGVPKEAYPEEFYIKFKERIIFNRKPTEYEAFDLLANRRLLSWMHQRIYAIARRIKPTSIMSGGELIPDLSTASFISTEEELTVEVFNEFLCFNILADNTKYHGLTMREWIRGYSSLKLVATLESAESHLKTFQKNELEQHFKNFGLHESCISTLIDHLTFGNDSSDLWDAPLIRATDDTFTVLIQPTEASNLPNVIISKLSSLETQFDKKGRGFEKKVLSFFTEKGYECKELSFDIDGDQFQYDALLLMEGTIILIECKNTTLSGGNVTLSLRYAEFIDETVEQIQRLERGLRAKPEIVEKLFGKKFPELKIISLILNSLTYSRTPIDGVYISDYSALSKIFNDNAISQISIKDGILSKKRTICQLWTGDHLTLQDLINYLKYPPQLKLFSDHFTYNKYCHPTSEESIFVSPVLQIDESAALESKKDAANSANI